MYYSRHTQKNEATGYNKRINWVAEPAHTYAREKNFTQVKIILASGHVHCFIMVLMFRWSSKR